MVLQHEPYGISQVSEVELKPGGADIAVTEANKREYVRSVNCSNLAEILVDHTILG